MILLEIQNMPIRMVFVNAVAIAAKSVYMTRCCRLATIHVEAYKSSSSLFCGMQHKKFTFLSGSTIILSYYIVQLY